MERESDLAEKKQGMSWRWGAHPQSKERGTEMPQIHGFNQKKKSVPVPRSMDLTTKKKVFLCSNAWM